MPVPGSNTSRPADAQKMPKKVVNFANSKIPLRYLTASTSPGFPALGRSQSGDLQVMAAFRSEIDFIQVIWRP